MCAIVFRWTFALWATLASLMLCSSGFAMGENAGRGQASAQRQALVIGNSAYEKTSPLENPAKDARLIAAALRNAGFNVRLRIDLTQKQMKRAMRDFSRELRSMGPGVVSLVYYAGHGTQVAGRNYLVPVDADIEVEQDVSIESLAVNDVLEQLENIKGSLSIIILDACRNNPYKRGRRASVRGLAPVKASKGSLIAYSTAPGTVALDGDGANSPYAIALNRHLRAKGLSIEKMFKNVRVDVDKATNGSQTPWEESSLFGDFVFLPAQPGNRSNRSQGDSRNAELAAETAFWNTVKDARNPSGIESYIRTFPHGLFTPLAKIKLAEQKAAHERALALIKERRVSKLIAQQKRINTLVQRQTKAVRTSIASPRAKAEECLDYFRKDGSDTYCVSSVLKSQQGNSYGVASLLDDSNYTAWFEGKPGDGIREWILVDFGGPRKVNKIIIKNGYNKNKAIYYKNSRIRSMKMTFSNGRKHVFPLNDGPEEQVIRVPRNMVANWVKLTILSVKRGNRYKDTGLNELRVITSPAS